MSSTPHLFLDTELAPPRQPWLGLTLSAVLHVALLVAALVWTRSEAKRDPRTEATAAQPERRVELATLPPYRPPAAPKPVTSAPVAPSRPVPQPPPDRMPRPQVKRGEHLPEEVTVSPQPPPETGPLAEAPPSSSVERPAPQPDRSTLNSRRSTPDELAMTEEAQRLFGRQQHGVTNATGPQPTARWLRELADDRDNDCRPSQRPRVDPGAPVVLGEVTGRVFREGTHVPLGGAFLQILGTSYSTFADDDGWYRLSFDQSLVDACRTQYVQVSKDGFRPRRLILGLGARTSNDIPMSRR